MKHSLSGNVIPEKSLFCFCKNAIFSGIQFAFRQEHFCPIGQLDSGSIFFRSASLPEEKIVRNDVCCYVFVILLMSFLVAPPRPAHAADTPALDSSLCNALVKHTPDADVAYRPGVDVNGNAVAPADLPGGNNPIKLPEKINIPVTVSLAKVLNLNANATPANQLGPGTEAQFGTLTVEGDRVTFNGQPLSDTQQDNLAVLCMRADK